MDLAGASVPRQRKDCCCRSAEIVRMALERIDCPRDDARWSWML